MYNLKSLITYYKLIALPDIKKKKKSNKIRMIYILFSRCKKI